MAPCKESSLQTVKSVQEILICRSSRERAALHIVEVEFREPSEFQMFSTSE